MPLRSFRLLWRLERRSSAIVKCRTMKGEIRGNQGALKKTRSWGRPSTSLVHPPPLDCPAAAISPPDAPRRKVTPQGVRDHDDSLVRLKYLTFATCSIVFFMFSQKQFSSIPSKAAAKCRSCPLHSRGIFQGKRSSLRPWWRFWQHHDIRRGVQASERR